MLEATVTTGAKPHGQQQLARDLEVERAVMGQRCRPQRDLRSNNVDGHFGSTMRRFGAIICRFGVISESYLRKNDDDLRF